MYMIKSNFPKLNIEFLTLKYESKYFFLSQNASRSVPWGIIRSNVHMVIKINYILFYV